MVHGRLWCATEVDVKQEQEAVEPVFRANDGSMFFISPKATVCVYHPLALGLHVCAEDDSDDVGDIERDVDLDDKSTGIRSLLAPTAAAMSSTPFNTTFRALFGHDTQTWEGLS